MAGSFAAKEPELPAHACPICQGTSEAFVPAGDDRTYFSCPHCQLIQLAEAHHLSPEKQKQRYEQHENSLDNPGYVERFEGFLKAGVDPFVGKGGRVLDFGCGPEPVLAWLMERRGYEVDRYDLFFHPDEAYRTQQYHLITLTEVLEHLTDPLGTLRALSPRLAPGGVFTVMTLFHPNDRAKFADWWYRRDPTHVSFYTVKTLGELANALGMKVLFSDAKNTVVLGAAGL